MASWSSPNLFLSILLLLISIQHSSSDIKKDQQALLHFINNIQHSSGGNNTHHCPRIHWIASIPVCDWYGVQCDCNLTCVEELHLGGACLIGEIPANTLSRLSNLTVLSLRDNHLDGSLPPDFTNLKYLRRICLKNNRLSGKFPNVLSEMTHLNSLDLSSNNISGPIPPALKSLTKLGLLYLEHNVFSGDLPDLDIDSLKYFNVSTNNLTGLIPKGLMKFPRTAFLANEKLYGTPLIVADLSLRKLSPAAKIAIIIASVLVFLILLLRLLFLIFRRWRDRTSRSPRKHVPPAAAGTPERNI